MIIHITLFLSEAIDQKFDYVCMYVTVQCIRVLCACVCDPVISAYALEKIIAHRKAMKKALNAMINIGISIPTTNEQN
jgi:hypothetical protein